MKLHAVKNGNRTFFEWTGTFRVAENGPAGKVLAESISTGVYAACMDGMKKLVTASS